MSEITKEEIAAEKAEAVAELKATIDKRAVKIQDVDARLERQRDHIKKIEKSQERFIEHRNRWAAQNHRDILKLKELGVDYDAV